MSHRCPACADGCRACAMRNLGDGFYRIGERAFLAWVNATTRCTAHSPPDPEHCDDCWLDADATPEEQRAIDAADVGPHYDLDTLEPIP
jgi:hypothetical protein